MKHKVLRKIFSSALDLTLIEHKKHIIELEIQAIDLLASGFSNPLTEDIVGYTQFWPPTALKKGLRARQKCFFGWYLGAFARRPKAS